VLKGCRVSFSNFVDVILGSVSTGSHSTTYVLLYQTAFLKKLTMLNPWKLIFCACFP